MADTRADETTNRKMKNLEDEVNKLGSEVKKLSVETQGLSKRVYDLEKFGPQTEFKAEIQPMGKKKKGRGPKGRPPHKPQK